MLQRLRGRLELRKASNIGRNVQVHGPIHLENLGRISLGDGVQLGGGAAPIHLVTAVGATLTVGDGSCIAHGCGVAAHASVTIGRSVQIGAFTLLMDSDFHTAGDHDAVSAPMPIVIGDNCWIGPHVTILRGARIGDGARVHARSVVTGDVPAGATVRGVPARLVQTDVDTEERVADSDDATSDYVRRLMSSALQLPELLDGSSDDAQVSWESLAALRVLLSLEERFRIQMRPERLEQLNTVRQIVQFINSERRKTA